MDDNRELRTFDDGEAMVNEMMNAEAAENAALQDEYEASQNIPDEQEEPAQEQLNVQNTESITDVQNAQPDMNYQNQMQMQQIMLENQQLRQQTQYLQQLLEQTNAQQRETTVENVTPENVPVMPELDFNALSFADEEQQRAATQKYASDMESYVMDRVMKKINPYIEESERNRAEAERMNALKRLENVPQLRGIGTMTNQLDEVIAKNDFLKSMPAEDRYITAFVLSKGAESINNPPKAPTVDELMNYYNSNQDFQNAVEKLRINQLNSNSGGNVPAMSASGGIGGAVVNVQEKPKNFDESLEFIKKNYPNLM